MSGNVTGSLDPNLRLGDKRQGRYPSPFFDIAQQYMPPTMKELFKWCYFYATTNSFVGPALNKIARYPVTDLVFETNDTFVKSEYDNIFTFNFKIKSFLMETNLDMCTYGNAFVTIHYPFTRFIVCRSCQHKEMFKTAVVKISPDLKVSHVCKRCNHNGESKIHDVTFRSKEKMRLVRLNPENMDIKYNDATADHVYLFSIPDKLKRMLTSGDKDIFETTPLVYIDAIKKRLKITLNKNNLFHLKRPTVAGKDFGWGIPLLSYVLKDLYYFYTVRRGQESVINEHITPLDIISPAANGTMDPYQHSNLGTFRKVMQEQINRHRKDPAYKAVMPFPVNHSRVGGDGKTMMLQGELDFMAKSIIGGMGIPQEFVYGGLTWSGSSVSLRTLENEFLHHRSQLLELCYWIKDRVRVYLSLPNISSMRFLDFKMADDVQRLSQIIGLEAAGKISTSTLMTELGYDFETEQAKRLSESNALQKVNEFMSMSSAITQGKNQEIQARQSVKLNKLMADLQGQQPGGTSGDGSADGSQMNPNGQPQPGQQPGQGQQQPQQQQAQPDAGAMPGDQSGKPGQTKKPELERTIDGLAKKLLNGDPQEGQKYLQELQVQAPKMAELVKAKMGEMQGSYQGATGQKPPAGYQKPNSGADSIDKVDMTELPSAGMPRRKGVV
jgi:hypothetical protein